MIRSRRPLESSDRPFAGARTKALTPAEQNKELLKQRIRKIHEERRIRSMKMGRTIRAIIYILLTIGSLVLIILSAFLILHLGSSRSTELNTWHFHPLPRTYGFAEFGVSSNSEFCNEMARKLYAEDFDAYEIAASMAICLFYSEYSIFHDGGMGRGVVISTELGTNSTTNFCEESSDEYGALASLLSRVEEKDGNVTNFQQKISKILEYVPVSRSAAKYFRRKDMELLLSDSARRGFIYNNESLTEGSSLEVITDNDGFLKEMWQSNWTKSYQERKQAVEVKLGQMACGATAETNNSFLDSVANASFLYSMVRPHATNVAIDITKDPVLYSLAHSIMRKSSSDPSKSAERAQNILYQGSPITLFRRSNKIGSKLRKKWEAPYSGNFFVLYDQNTGKAISFSQTSAKYELTQVSSNSSISSMKRRYWPAIIFDNSGGLVWAGPAGDVTMSMDHSRTTHVLLAYILSNTPVPIAVTTPLVFPYRRDNFYTDGFAMNVLSSVMAKALISAREDYWGNVIHLDKQKSWSLKDTGAAIHVRDNETIPIFFDNNGPWIMPNGV